MGRKFGHASPKVILRMESIHDTERLVQPVARVAVTGSILQVFSVDTPAPA